MKEEVAVVIPYYHSALNELEQVSFRQCIKILYNYQIILIVPDVMDEDQYPTGKDFIFIKVSSQWLESVTTYNRMMLDLDFYKLFLNYKYILIYQLDAFVFYDKLQWFCDLGYDYIGALWPLGTRYIKDEKNCIWYVGNGGLSLRNVKASISMLKKNPADLWKLQEDVYWATCASEGFRVAPKEIAIQFSIEMHVRKMYALNGNKLPFGCHAWEKMDFPFWRPFFEREGYILPKRVNGELDRDHETARIDILSISSKIVMEALRQFVSNHRTQRYIWGAGEIGKEFMLMLRHADININCVDSNPDKWGKYLWDVKIESPRVLENKKEEILIIIAVRKLYKNEIVDSLTEMGFIEGKEIYYYSDIINKIFELYEKSII